MLITPFIHLNVNTKTSISFFLHIKVHSIVVVVGECGFIHTLKAFQTKCFITISFTLSLVFSLFRTLFLSFFLSLSHSFIPFHHTLVFTKWIIVILRSNASHHLFIILVFSERARSLARSFAIPPHSSHTSSIYSHIIHTHYKFHSSLCRWMGPEIYGSWGVDRTGNQYAGNAHHHHEDDVKSVKVKN